MLKDDNDVIRYLMKEMDPSEEVLMERAMMEDDDLLIEVESMRQTLQRLDDLPEKEPPAKLSESIIQQAAEHKKRSMMHWPSIPSEVFKYAAVLIIGMGLGSSFWLFIGPSGKQHTQQVQKMQLPASVAQNTASAQSSKARVKPWVDRHNVLYFQDKFNKKSGYEAIRQASMQKLTPIQNPSSQFNPDARGVHLTSDEQR